MGNVENLRELMATFYNRPVFSTNQRSNPVYTVPYHDGFGFGKSCKRPINTTIVVFCVEILLCVNTFSIFFQTIYKTRGWKFTFRSARSGRKTQNSIVITGIVITACLPIHRNGKKFEGVACVDMLMRDLISHLTAFPNLDVGYTLMLDSAGKRMVTVVQLKR